MQPDPGTPEDPLPQEPGGAPGEGRDKSTLDLVFITITGILVVGAFITALTYEGSSGIAPLCIMVPLLLLIGWHFRRTLQASRADRVLSEIMSAVRGSNKIVNGALVFIAWMVALVGLIFVAGHYVGIAVFMFVLLRIVSKESMVMSIGVSAGVTLVIFLLFEYAFRIQMYRGVLDRWF